MITNKNSAIIKSQGKNSNKDIYHYWVKDNGVKKDKSKDKDNYDIAQTI